MNVNETIKIRSVVSGAPKHLMLAMASRRAAFNGNTSLIATFSIVKVLSVASPEFDARRCTNRGAETKMYPYPSPAD